MAPCRRWQSRSTTSRSTEQYSTRSTPTDEPRTFSGRSVERSEQIPQELLRDTGEIGRTGRQRGPHLVAGGFRELKRRTERENRQSGCHCGCHFFLNAERFFYWSFLRETAAEDRDSSSFRTIHGWSACVVGMEPNSMPRSYTLVYHGGEVHGVGPIVLPPGCQFSKAATHCFPPRRGEARRAYYEKCKRTIEGPGGAFVASIVVLLREIGHVPMQHCGHGYEPVPLHRLISKVAGVLPRTFGASSVFCATSGRATRVSGVSATSECAPVSLCVVHVFGWCLDC